jgi:hypothetical protein
MHLIHLASFHPRPPDTVTELGGAGNSGHGLDASAACSRVQHSEEENERIKRIRE